MSGKITRAAYEQMIVEDLAWLMKQPKSLERDHIALVLMASPEREYPPLVCAWHGCSRPVTHSCSNALPTCIVHKSSCCRPLSGGLHVRPVSETVVDGVQRCAVAGCRASCPWGETLNEGWETRNGYGFVCPGHAAEIPRASDG